MNSFKFALVIAFAASPALGQTYPSPTFATVTATSYLGTWNGNTVAVNKGGTGITAFGTGVATALGQNVTGSGSIALSGSPTFTGVVTTPSLAITASISGAPAATSYANPIALSYGAQNNTGHRNIGMGPSCTVNSSSYKGELFCAYSSVIVDSIAATSAAGDNQFTASFSFANGNGNVTSANAGVFAGNDNLAVVGTGWAYAVGREIDVTVYQPVTNKQAIRIVQGYPDAYQGSTQDGAIVGVNQSGPGGLLPIGWKNFIYLDTASSTIPVLNTSNGCIICVGGAQTTNSGVDISGWTFSAYAFKSTGFSVDGLGKVASVGYYVGATAGVDCSGAPTGSFAVTKGIVTHC